MEIAIIITVLISFTLTMIIIKIEELYDKYIGESKKSTIIFGTLRITISIPFLIVMSILLLFTKGRFILKFLGKNIFKH